jgi:putative ABC transport system ATP-binding protein
LKSCNLQVGDRSHPGPGSPPPPARAVRRLQLATIPGGAKDMDEEPALRAEHLEKGFGDKDDPNRTLAVRDVSMELARGQISLLMGPSGSGKSTLLAILSGLLAPDKYTGGRVLVHDGKSYSDLWQMTAAQREHFRLLHYGFIFQGYNLFPALTARQQLEIVLRWGQGLGGRKARQEADRMLSLLGLAHRADRRPAELSGGEKQRVAIARALVKHPRFCFADEPTSALDWGHGEQVIELLRAAAHDHGAAVLVVTHDPRLLPYADNVFHLEDGALADAEPEDAPVIRADAPPYLT